MSAIEIEPGKNTRPFYILTFLTQIEYFYSVAIGIPGPFIDSPGNLVNHL
ncbi:hypothetical protein SAMN05661012_05188 [Chitinophaga sancti]|uniref:Uncharacterized protein n=1 Tax=Chitinophaga sancti TaxID=1004 RepID=A0A1K1SD62_9BACT|nr:hypothetical protein SAMN05661012_05188 [Chitinophaga sancti]